MNIKIKNLHKSFEDNYVLKGLNLEIKSGEVTVILGGSGSGKSVLLKHIVGLMRPDKGEIWIDNTEITRLGENELLPLRRKIGLVFQTGGLWRKCDSAPEGTSSGTE